jgi:hypothetical protein
MFYLAPKFINNDHGLGGYSESTYMVGFNLETIIRKGFNSGKKLLGIPLSFVN